MLVMGLGWVSDINPEGLMIGLCGPGKWGAAMQLLSMREIIPRPGPAHQPRVKPSSDHKRTPHSQVQLPQATGKPWPYEEDLPEVTQNTSGQQDQTSCPTLGLSSFIHVCIQTFSACLLYAMPGAH